MKKIIAIILLALILGMVMTLVVSKKSFAKSDGSPEDTQNTTNIPSSSEGTEDDEGGASTDSDNSGVFSKEVDGDLVESYTISGSGSNSGQYVSYNLASGKEYGLILNEVYNNKEIFVEIDGKLVSISEYDGFCHYISLADYTSSSQVCVRIYLEGRTSFVKDYFALYMLDSGWGPIIPLS